jgi:hypothetical protein
MATKGALSSLPKLTPAYGLEEGQTDDAVERATDRVMQAYAARQNLGYDPTLMAFSQAMLSSKGNFGEGLGAGLKGAQEAQQLNRQQDIEEAQAGLTMAQAQREQQNAQRAASMFGELTGPAQARPTGLPADGVSLPPAANGPAGQQGSAPAGMRPITLEMAEKFKKAFPKDKDYGSFLMDAAKMYQGRFLMSDQGVFDTMADGGRGAFVDLPMRNQKPYEYSTVGGTLTMTPAEYDHYKMSASKGLGKQWVEAYKAGESTDLIEEIAFGKKGIMSLPAPKEVIESQPPEIPKVISPAAVAEPSGLEKKPDEAQSNISAILAKPTRPNGILSKEDQAMLDKQLDLNADIAKQQAASNIAVEKVGKEEAAKQEAERRAEFKTKADVARESIEMARQFRKFASDPAAEKIMGVFSNNKVFSAIVNLVESGVGVSGFSIGIPEISNIVKNLNLDPTEMQKAQTLGMLIANMQLSKGKLLKGSTSNYETALMGRAGVTDKDIPLTVRAKADMLERKAQYHQDLDEAFDDFKGSVSTFYRSKKYKDMFSKYLDDLTGMAVGEKQMNSPEPAKAPAAPAKSPDGKKVRDIEGAAKKLG